MSEAGPVARLLIRRGEKLNALDASMIEALRDACAQLDRSEASVVILAGEGDRAFSAGGDITAWSALSPTQFSRRWIRDGHAVFDALARLRQPVIAVLNGHALGGGFELAACADFRIAEAHCKIGQPEAALGVIAGWSGTQRAVRRFGAQIVRRMALFGEVLTAEQALACGVVDQVVPKGERVSAAEALAKRVFARSPRATEITKMLIYAAEGEETERVLDSLASAAAAASADLQEGLSAFREKRPPAFDRATDAQGAADTL